MLPIRSLRFQSVLLVLVLFMCGQPIAAADVVSGQFNLISHDGQPVSEQSFEGKLRLVFFGFTRCPDVCPTTLLEVRRVMQLLGDDASQVQPLFISVDRNYDTPERIANYVDSFHPAVIGLTGSEQQLEAAAGAFNVTYMPSREDEAGGGMFHGAYLFLMDRQGRFLEVFGNRTKAATIEAKLREYL